MFTEGILLGAALLVLVLVARSYVYVSEGEVAVLTRFGRAVRSRQNLPARARCGTPFHKLPWDQVLRVSIKEQSVELTGEEDRAVMTNDGIVVRYQSALRFAPLNDKLEHYLFGFSPSRLSTWWEPSRAYCATRSPTSECHQEKVCTSIRRSPRRNSSSTIPWGPMR